MSNRRVQEREGRAGCEGPRGVESLSVDTAELTANASRTSWPEMRARVRPVKRGILGIVAITSMTGIAGCSGTSTHIQSVSPAASSSSGTNTASVSPTTSTSSSTSAAAPSSPLSSSPSTPRVTIPKPIPTPTVKLRAQKATDAYISMANILNAWDYDPAKANAALLRPYVTDKTVTQIVAIYKDMAAHGLAYRGDPDTPHLTVLVASSSFTALSDCPTPSTTNPSVQYVVATGKPVPPPANVIPGLHPKEITVLYTAGRWKVQSVIPNEAKVCRS